MKTYSAKPRDFKQDWYVVDGTDKVLGRLAARSSPQAARQAQGDLHAPHGHRRFHRRHQRGKAARDRQQGRATSSTTATAVIRAGSRRTTFAKMQARFPGRVLEKAVKGMLPKGPLGYAMIKKLKCYAGPSHPHSAQQPKALEL